MVYAAAPVGFQRWTGMVVKLCDHSVDLPIWPIIEQVGVNQLWERGLHGGGLFDGALFDAMAVIQRKRASPCWRVWTSRMVMGKGPIQQLVQPSRQGTSPSRAAVARWNQ